MFPILYVPDNFISEFLIISFPKSFQKSGLTIILNFQALFLTPGFGPGNM